jgi:hypothetical protein
MRNISSCLVGCILNCRTFCIACFHSRNRWKELSFTMASDSTHLTFWTFWGNYMAVFFFLYCFFSMLQEISCLFAHLAIYPYQLWDLLEWASCTPSVHHHQSRFDRYSHCITSLDLFIKSAYDCWNNIWYPCQKLLILLDFIASVLLNKFT